MSGTIMWLKEWKGDGKDFFSGEWFPNCPPRQTIDDKTQEKRMKMSAESRNSCNMPMKKKSKEMEKPKKMKKGGKKKMMKEMEGY